MFSSKNNEKGSLQIEKSSQRHRREKRFSPSSSVEKKNKKREKVQKKKSKYSRSNSNSSGRNESPYQNQNEVVVKGINFSARDDDIQSFLEKKFGKISKFNLLKDFQGNSKGLAFVGFSNEDSSQKALQQGNNIEFMGRNIIIEKPNDRRQNRNKDEESNTIFVGNLSFKTESDDVINFFSSCGDILNCKIALQNGRSRGFCHLKFAEKSSLQKALKKDGMELDGRELKVNLANNKQRYDGQRDYQRNQSFQKYNQRKFDRFSRKDDSDDDNDNRKYKQRK